MNRLFLALLLILVLPIIADTCRFTDQGVYTSPDELIKKSQGLWKKIFFGVDKPRRSFHQPSSVASANNMIAVADMAAGKVWLAGDKKHPVSLSPPEGFGSPVDLVFGKDELFVSDSSEKRVWSYNLKSKRWKEIVHVFVRPTGLFYSADRETLLIADTGAHAIYTFQSEKICSLISEGLNFPTDVVAGGDEIYIADAMDHQIEVWSWEGKRIRVFGESGNKHGYFAFMRGLALDRTNERLFVSDVHMNWIQVFDRMGKLLFVYGGEGVLHHPSYINYIDKTLWLADSFSGRVLKLGVSCAN
ncbi:MAG TPA: hypothetical protein PK014_03675 [Thermoanaerobaculia bacterium]|nr:hypothetical protein [Thermoanaerobaculia bacterium]HUM29125.1 hypothetical protein [Thermoanaerobaculia bacterium]HXK67502.1 hypothetical protein [Thermoanaerobaculia bacterium]